MAIHKTISGSQVTGSSVELSKQQTWVWEPSTALVVIKIMRLNEITHRENTQREREQHAVKHYVGGDGVETGPVTTTEKTKPSPKGMQRSAADEVSCLEKLGWKIRI